jgi:hypothetical protein
MQSPKCVRGFSLDTSNPDKAWDRLGYTSIASAIFVLATECLPCSASTQTTVDLVCAGTLFEGETTCVATGAVCAPNNQPRCLAGDIICKCHPAIRLEDLLPAPSNQNPTAPCPTDHAHALGIPVWVSSAGLRAAGPPVVRANRSAYPSCARFGMF